MFQKQRAPAFKEIQVPNNYAKFSKGKDSVCLFLPVVALAELTSVCFVQILEFSPLQRNEQNYWQRWSKGKMAEKCGFLHPDLMEEEGPRLWNVSSDLGSC